MGLHLTARDYKILDLLTNQGFAFFEQIQVLGFPSRESTKLRLAALQRAGFIHSEKLTISPPIKKWFREIWSQNSNHVTYGLVHRKIYKPGRSSLTQLRPGVDRTEKMIRHQLGLNRTLEQIVKVFKDPLILTEADVAHEDRNVYGGDSKLLPDLVMIEDRIKLAVEYERNIKARKKYLEKWYRYKSSPLYSHVLYVCENQIIFDALSKNARGFPKMGFSMVTDPNKIMTGMGWMSIKVFLQ